MRSGLRDGVETIMHKEHSSPSCDEGWRALCGMLVSSASGERALVRARFVWSGHSDPFCFRLRPRMAGKKLTAPLVYAKRIHIDLVSKPQESAVGRNQRVRVNTLFLFCFRFLF